MPASVITRRARNRALLARQMLLERASTTPLRVIERLVGMQAQTPRSPYIGLWSRLNGFDPMQLSRTIEDRRTVRIALMRSTIHLVTASDALLLRPLVMPPLLREIAMPAMRASLEGLDLTAVAAEARRLLEQQPMTAAQLGAALAKRWPERQPHPLAQAARTLLPLVQIPPRGLWNRSGATTLTTAEHWLGQPVAESPSWDAVVLRYLAAFGPATTADVVAWSKVTGMTEVIARLRPKLRVLHDEDGRELFDTPRAPRPPAATPAPPRFLPDYDNLLLAHSDRRHVWSEEHRKVIQSANGAPPGSVLVDGFVAASWSIEHDQTTARLMITELEPIPAKHRDAIAREGQGLLALLAPDATRTQVLRR